MKIYFLLFTFLPICAICQVGINITNNTLGAFHVDGARDNTSTSPNASQQLNDVMVTNSGNLGIGTTSPAAKVEIVSNVSNSSGLLFTKANSTSTISDSPVVSGLGVDIDGNVVTADRPFFAAVNAVVINGSSAFLSHATLPFFILNVQPNTPVKIPLNSNGSNLVDSFTINVPSSGRGVMINFMVGIDSYGYQLNTCTAPCSNGPNPRDIFQARLYIDGVAKPVYQNVEMNLGNGAGTSDSNLQFNFSTLQNLTEGNHIIDVRVSKVNNLTLSTANGNIRFQTLSSSINATYIQ